MENNRIVQNKCCNRDCNQGRQCPVRPVKHTRYFFLQIAILIALCVLVGILGHSA